MAANVVPPEDLRCYEVTSGGECHLVNDAYPDIGEQWVHFKDAQHKTVAAFPGHQVTAIGRVTHEKVPEVPAAPARPSVGRIVHYVSHGTPVRPNGSQAFPAECRAAIVTEVGEVWVPEGEAVPDGTPVSLCVLNPAGMFFNQGVLHSELENQGGTWHWPERTP